MILALALIAAVLVLLTILAALALCAGAARGDAALEAIARERRVDDALDILRAEVQAVYRMADRHARGDTDLAIQIAAREFRARQFDALDTNLMLSVHYDKGINEVRWLTAGSLDGIRGSS